MRTLMSYLRRQDGSSTIEFVLLFPAYILVLLAAIEAGALMLREVFLERGVDMAIRELRLGGASAPTNETDLKKLICNFAGFLPNCTRDLRLELTQVDMTSFAMPTTRVTCTERGKMAQPATTYQPGAPQDLMLLRACMVFDPWFPSTGLGLRLPKDASGAYALVTASAFVIEPK